MNQDAFLSSFIGFSLGPTFGTSSFAVSLSMVSSRRLSESISFSENTDIYTTRIMNLILFNSLISIKTEISGIFIHVFDF
jgi:hypothetical protein